MIFALQKLINWSVATLVIIAFVFATVLGVGLWKTISGKNADERSAQMLQYSVGSNGMALSLCFQSRQGVDGGTYHIVDKNYDGDLRQCVIDAFGKEFRNEPGWLEAVDGHPALEGFFTTEEVEVVLKAFEGRDEKSLDAAPDVIERYRKVYGPAQERFREEAERRMNAFSAKQFADEQEAKAAKVVIDKARARASGKTSAEVRSAIVLASCKYDDESGGYQAALDAFQNFEESPRGDYTGWPDEYQEVFDGARKALCD